MTQYPTSTKIVIAGLDPAIHHQMGYWVYILASAPGVTLYIRVTNNLVRRVYEHREMSPMASPNGTTSKSSFICEPHDTINAAIQREKISNTGRASGRSI